MLKNGLVILVLLSSTFGYAQDDEYVSGDTPSETTNTSKKSGFDWRRATIGGGFYAAFGSNSYFLIAPTFGYHLTDNFLVGIGINYSYQKVTRNVAIPYKRNDYGTSIYGQFKLGELPFLAHAELEYVNLKVDFQNNLREDLALNLINPYVGGGLKQQMGDYSYFYALILFNLNETKESEIILQNPIIRIGFSIGL
jgi:hypothetical protein